MGFASFIVPSYHLAEVFHSYQLKRNNPKTANSKEDVKKKKKIRIIKNWRTYMSVLDLNVKQKFSFFFLFLKFFSYFIYFYFIYLLLFLAALGLCCCAWPFSSCGKRGLLFIAVCGLLSSWWLLLLQSTGSRHEGFGSCGTRAQ